LYIEEYATAFSFGGNMASKKKKTSAGKIVLFVAEILILVALLVVMWLVLKTTDKEEGVQKVSIDEKEIEVALPEEVKENEAMKGYRNIALFGVDSRTGQLDSKTRSDTIIIASINQDTKEVKLVSVYRDSYLNIDPGKTNSYDKCNSAYAYGGADRAIKMLNANLDLNITDFITIGFEGLRDVVNALGGVYIEVDEEEIKHLNNYQISMVEKMSDVDSYTPVKDTGYQLLDGLQATAYCRIRYTAGNDFKRTERQREVIKACLDVAKTTSVSKLKSACENIFSEVHTSLSLPEILDLLVDVASYEIVDEGGFPSKDHYTTGMIDTKSCVIPVDLQTNVVWLHKFLFNEDDYKPSANISEYSDEIKRQASKYLGSQVEPSDDFGDD
jgi:LCP family protein required for cell wall assembly